MKHFSIFLTFLILSGCQNAEVKSHKEETSGAPTTFDSTLAHQFGADDYGMKTYVMAFLKRGPNRDQDSATAARLQAAHMANISRLAKEGKLVLAGPFLDDGDLRGIYIFDVKTIAEARKLTESDPAIREGRLIMELRPWYGSAALMGLNDTHQKISKTPF